MTDGGGCRSGTSNPGLCPPLSPAEETVRSTKRVQGQKKKIYLFIHFGRLFKI